MTTRKPSTARLAHAKALSRSIECHKLTKEIAELPQVANGKCSFVLYSLIERARKIMESSNEA
jgi:hypothetical protein